MSWWRSVFWSRWSRCSCSCVIAPVIWPRSSSISLEWPLCVWTPTSAVGAATGGSDGRGAGSATVLGRGGGGSAAGFRRLLVQSPAYVCGLCERPPERQAMHTPCSASSARARGPVSPVKSSVLARRRGRTTFSSSAGAAASEAPAPSAGAPVAAARPAGAIAAEP